MLGSCTDQLIDEARLRFGYEVLQELNKMPTKIEEGSTWYILPMKWYNKWEAYCYTDLMLQQDL